jgi:hypothetical protein
LLDYGAVFTRQEAVFIGDVPVDAQIGPMRFAGRTEVPDLQAMDHRETSIVKN